MLCQVPRYRYIPTFTFINHEVKPKWRQLEPTWNRSRYFTIRIKDAVWSNNIRLLQLILFIYKLPHLMYSNTIYHIIFILYNTYFIISIEFYVESISIIMIKCWRYKRPIINLIMSTYLPIYITYYIAIKYLWENSGVIIENCHRSPQFPLKLFLLMNKMFYDNMMANR